MNKFEDSGEPLTSDGIARFLSRETTIPRPLATPTLGAPINITNVAINAFQQAEVYLAYRHTHLSDGTPNGLPDIPVDTQLLLRPTHFTPFLANVRQQINIIRRTTR